MISKSVIHNNYNMFINNNCPLEILLRITGYLDDYSCIQFIQISKTIYNLFRNESFLKHININNNYHTNHELMFLKLKQHYKTMENLSIKYLHEPHHWFPYYYPQYTHFFHCSFNSVFKPLQIMYKTTMLIFTNNKFIGNKNKIGIDWSKFPNLEYFYYNGQVGLEFDGILEHCSKLVYFRYYTNNFDNEDTNNYINIQKTISSRIHKKLN